jgi:hypothetical protein
MRQDDPIRRRGAPLPINRERTRRASATGNRIGRPVQTRRPLSGGLWLVSTRDALSLRRPALSATASVLFKPESEWNERYWSTRRSCVSTLVLDHVARDCQMVWQARAVLAGTQSGDGLVQVPMRAIPTTGASIRCPPMDP